MRSLDGKWVCLQAFPALLWATIAVAQAPEAEGTPEGPPEEAPAVIEQITPDAKATPAAKEEEVLRFGDPETFLYEPEPDLDATPTATPTASPSLATTPFPTPSLATTPLPTPISPPAALPATTSLQTSESVPQRDLSKLPVSDQVRALIASVSPGNEYAKPFAEIVAFGPQAVPALSETLADPSKAWEWRWMAAMGLGRVGGAQAREALLAGLRDPFFLVRMACVRALGTLKDPTTAPNVRAALDDPALVVRSAAVDTLSDLKDVESVPRLIEELSSRRNFQRGRSLWIREHILDALEAIGDPKAIPAFLTILKEEDWTLRKKGCDALAHLAPTAPPAAERSLSCVEQWLSWHEKTNVPTP